jgi:hypothetical protein
LLPKASLLIPKGLGGFFFLKTTKKGGYMHLTAEQVLQYFLPHSGRIYVTEEFLLKFLLFDPKVLKVRKSESRHGKTDNWSFVKTIIGSQECIIFDLLSIPKNTLDKYDFPDLLWIARHFPKNIQLQCLPEGIPATELELRLDIEKGIKEGEKNIGYFYSQEIHHGTTINLARKFGVLLFAIKYIKALNKNHGLRKRLFVVLQSDEFKHLDFPNNASTFYGYILRALRAFEEHEIDGLIKFVKGKYGVPSNALKVNKSVIALIMHYASHVNPISNKDIRIWVNTTLLCFPELNGGKTLGQTTIDQLVTDLKTRIEIKRGGEEFIRKCIAPYMDTIQAENPFDQFQFDEWYVEFSSKDGNKTVPMIMLTLMDTCSRKTIIRRYTKSLDSKFLKSFLHDSIVLSGYRIPAEYVCDFSSVNAAGIIKEVFGYFMTKFPGKFFWTLSSNPNRKAILERYFRTIASYLAPHIGWKGFGITSRGDSQPAKVVKLILNDPKYLDDEKECIRMLENFHDLHNKNGIHLDQPSPNQTFERSPKPNAIRLSNELVAYAFYRKEQRTLLRGIVDIDNRLYENIDLAAALNINHKVTCCLDNSQACKTVYVFKLNSDEFIGEFTLREDPIHSAKINQTEEDKHKLQNTMKKIKELIKKLKSLDSDELQLLLKRMGGVNPGEFVMDLLESQLPSKSTDVSEVTGNKSYKKIELNPFDVSNLSEQKKGMQKAHGKKSKPKQKKFIPTDNMKPAMNENK